MAEGIKKQFLRLTLIVSLQLTLFSALHGAKWTYDGTEGQDHWSERYPYCGGALQSPIDIETDLLRFDPTLRPIEVQNYNLSPNEQITLGNNGHSVQLSLPPKMYISSLPNHFTAAQLHLHWGSPSWPAGSEHTVNSKRYAAEVNNANSASHYPLLASDGGK